MRALLLVDRFFFPVFKYSDLWTPFNPASNSIVSLVFLRLLDPVFEIDVMLDLPILMVLQILAIDNSLFVRVLYLDVTLLKVLLILAMFNTV